VKAIIIAAGKGKRLWPLTSVEPKCIAIKVDGKSLLDIELDAMRSCHINNISIIRGYQAEKISVPNVKYYLNDAYARNNILSSLMYAEPELNDNVLISYSDIWYDTAVLKQLIKAPGDIVIAVDPNWASKYREHQNQAIAEAEVVKWNSKKCVVQIGKIATAPEKFDGEFMGLIKCSKRGCEIWKDEYSNVKQKFKNKPFQRAASLELAYLTDLLQELADHGVRVQCAEISGTWIEVDTAEDYAFLKKNYPVGYNLQ
jgi:L-glutamine-phosphate cytidylyltransferase